MSTKFRSLVYEQDIDDPSPTLISILEEAQKSPPVDELFLSESRPLSHYLLPFRELRTLHLTGTYESENDFAILEFILPQLVDVQLGLEPMTMDRVDRIIRKLSPSRLKSVAFRLGYDANTARVSAAWIRGCARFPNLTAFRQDGSFSSDDHVDMSLLCEYIKAPLTSLYLSYCWLQHFDTNILSRCYPNLIHLCLIETYQDAGIINLNCFPALRTVKYYSQRGLAPAPEPLDVIQGDPSRLQTLHVISPASLSSNISNCVSLEELTLFQVEKPVLLVILRSCRRLRVLDICREEASLVTEECIQLIRRHPTLKELSVDDANIELQMALSDAIERREKVTRIVIGLLKRFDRVPAELWASLYTFL